jgi:Na+/H+ antiporter NhaD/arsenite permease-like protein
VTAPETTGGGIAALDGTTLGIETALPFAGLLLSLAFLPLVATHFWHRNYGKVVAAWAALGLVLIIDAQGFHVALHELLHVALLDYIPFIILLVTLYTITGGIRISGRMSGTPFSNTLTLGTGTVLAGFMGTTGASMLLVRPMLQANAHRQHKKHVFIFLIFLVANIGGAMSPLGDPPLFLGFLKGVDFFWPTIHLALPTLICSVILLSVFYLLDRVHYDREPRRESETFVVGGRLEIRGWLNLLLLGLLILAVILSGKYQDAGAISIAGIPVGIAGLLRDAVLIGLCAASLWLTEPGVRAYNSFEWGPMIEVALVFAAIFVTIVAPLAILRAGQDGALAGLLTVLDDGTLPGSAAYFWMTGVLSAFLDNAPTYLAFFNAAGGDAKELMGPLAKTLGAISAGAVYMGAMSYIGNAPNFMVRSVVASQGVAMPSFFGYMGWSCLFLLPVFVLVTVLFYT